MGRGAGWAWPSSLPSFLICRKAEAVTAPGGQLWRVRVRPQSLEKWRDSREPLAWQKPLKARGGRHQVLLGLRMHQK